MIQQQIIGNAQVRADEVKLASVKELRELMVRNGFYVPALKSKCSNPSAQYPSAQIQALKSKRSNPSACAAAFEQRGHMLLVRER
jgi:hypothetical protein